MLLDATIVDLERERAWVHLPPAHAHAGLTVPAAVTTEESDRESKRAPSGSAPLPISPRPESPMRPRPGSAGTSWHTATSCFVQDASDRVDDQTTITMNAVQERVAALELRLERLERAVKSEASRSEASGIESTEPGVRLVGFGNTLETQVAAAAAPAGPEEEYGRLRAQRSEEDELRAQLAALRELNKKKDAMIRELVRELEVED